MTSAPIMHIESPEWLEEWFLLDKEFVTDREKMKLVLSLARSNVEHGGGPFGAAVFEMGRGRLLSVGVNLVLSARCSVLHAEIVALCLAQQRLGHYFLARSGQWELFSSCDPCAMCLGAVLWSGVKRLVCAASGQAARAIGFDEGPVFAESWSYLQEAGVKVCRGMLSSEAEEILRSYQDRGGEIYNG